MGVARQQHLLELLALALEQAEQGQHLVPEAAQLIPQVEFDVDQDLVVAAAPGMNLLAEVAELAGEEEFYLGVNVFHIILQHKGARRDAGGDFVQSAQQGLQLVGAEQADALQHRNVGLRALHIVGCEPQVEDAVVADREVLHLFGGGGAFIPKCCHKMFR